jgi:hypothetical protein
MKKTLVLLAIALLFSCSKKQDDSPRCWECDITTTYEVAGQPTEVINQTFKDCSMLEETLINYSNSNNYVKEEHGIKVTQVCVCREL